VHNYQKTSIVLHHGSVVIDCDNCINVKVLGALSLDSLKKSSSSSSISIVTF